ncbi:PREDICTED: telomerase protein component 1 [Cyprinodon variegatus]|nr:PREDICTED: telomerase protein component 1 [Cyprinodon variegatus]
MRSLTLEKMDVASGEQQHLPTCGSSLTSNYCPPSLENKILMQASATNPQPWSSLFPTQPSSHSSLQPTSLSSTSSFLLSSSCSADSPLLSTHNKLLTTSSSLTPSLTSTVPSNPLVFSTLTGNLQVSGSYSFLKSNLSGEKKIDEEAEDEDDEEISEDMQSSFEETSVLDEDQMSEEDGGGGDAETAAELPVIDMEWRDHEGDDAGMIKQEEFAELDGGTQSALEDLKDKKYLLLNAVCCSLVNKSKAPGQQDWDSENSVWTRITDLAKDISVGDPQFLLKVAVYSRQELNIRITTNFLLALAASLNSTKPHVRRYFCAAVQLPSDWLEVVRIYTTCFSPSLPTCLKKAMVDKFKQFNEYQLAKYNTRKHRCKHNRQKPKRKKPTSADFKQWAKFLNSEPEVLKKYLQVEDGRVVVDKKQGEFSLKKLIKKLHIKEPADLVMAILGKKYPSDAKAFIHSGIKGVWDPDRAGQRMKLKEPQTWERLLSMEGNKAATWQKLIDSRSLPFMAMLRNLRNMITKGISEAHHKKILSRLTNKNAIIQSRQFPFRFLAAYKVIMELRALASASEKAIPSTKEILVSILKKIPKSRRSKSHDWQTCKKRGLKLTLGVPFIYRLYKNKKAQLLKASQRLYSVDLLDRYRKALETAVQISCSYNVPLLPGKTIILVMADTCSDESWSKKQDFCLPHDPDEQEDEEDQEEKGTRKHGGNEEAHNPLTPTMDEVLALLALMIKSRSEDCRLCLSHYSCGKEVELSSDVLLENVRSLVKELKDFGNNNEEQDTSFYYRLFSKKNKVDNIITFRQSWLEKDLECAIKNYRKENKKTLYFDFVLVDGSSGESEKPRDRNAVELRGFSEQILRFITERGSSRLLDHVENLDKLYNIPPPDGAKEKQISNNTMSLPAIPKLRWRGVRVFISSTFRDMHAERDVLVRSVFPELRRRAAAHCLHLQEVELRWGVTEEESERATELCLSEVCRSQMLVGILGERYGQVPPRPVLPDLPQYSWLDSAPAGLSITEMEIRQFQALYPDSANQRMFCYFRDPVVIKSVPVAWRSHFASESNEAEKKLTSLKRRLLDDGVKVTENYSCMWGGVVEGKPYLKKLEDFGNAVLEDLWVAVTKLFVNEDEEAETALEVSEQEVLQGALQKQFFGRAKLLSNAVGKVEQVQNKGGMLVIEGGPGEGKTVFMAALAEAIRSGLKSKTKLCCDVISYSTAASQSARSVGNLLRCLVQCLREIKHTQEESPLPHLYKDLLSEFHSTLGEMKKDKPLVVLVDGVDLVQDDKGQFSSDWIPQLLPQGVCLVLSISSNTPLLQTLVRKRGTVLFSLGQLSMPDKREIVQKELDVFGKKLSDSAFNNQLQTLITKKGAVSPLYLHLACEDLRNFASFEKLKETLQDLPQSLSLLVQYSLERLCIQYRTIPGLRLTLAALTVSNTGLTEPELYSLLRTCNDLSSRGEQMTWEEVLHLSRKPKGRIPMAVFTQVVRNLQSLTGLSHCQYTNDVLALNNPEVKRGFENFLLLTEHDIARAHLVLAGHLWAMADPEGKHTFLRSEANSVMHLPSSLIQSGQLGALHSLLSNYYFLRANVSLGLLHHLLETYDLYDKESTTTALLDPEGRLDDCRCFLKRHTSTLSLWPALFIQQALNEPPETSAHIWAKGLVGKAGVCVIECLNSSKDYAEEGSELVSTFSSEPTCVVLSPDKRLIVVATGRGSLHAVSAQTGQEVKSLVSSCDGISSCVFLNDAQLASTSFDGRIEVWDMQNGCRTALIEGHTNTITASDITPDRKHLATVSLDHTLKVWAAAKANEVASLPSTSPLNCVTFDPEGYLLAAGCWDGSIIVWNWLQNHIQASLCGHRRSVRSLSFSPSSSMLCSGSMSGEVRVWSTSTSTCVGCFQAHCGTTEKLTFLEEGSMLLSAGSDHTLQLWSGGLGRSVASLKSDECEFEPPQKKKKLTSEAAALCVAIDGDYAAVGYHGDGIKLFRVDSGEKMWVSADLSASVHCLLWVHLDPEQSKPELLLSGGSDKCLRLWRKTEGEEGMLEGLIHLKTFGVQKESILAVEQNSTVLATASDDFTIALWPLKDLTENSSIKVSAVLRGHQGGVTCMAFSPDGSQLLSGGKDKALMLWNPDPFQAALLKSFPHCHRDWITDCAWTPDCTISSSNDGRLCFWDLETGSCLREISWRNPLSSVCCVGPHVIAGCSEGTLHVWKWHDKTEICHISAHKEKINYCRPVPNTVPEKETKPEELTVFTASDDGSVQLWKPLQVEHLHAFLGHSGAVHGVAQKGGVPEFLTVSEDGSLRCWKTDTAANLKGPISALCFSKDGDFLLVGYESGLLELWQNNSVVEHKQVSDGPITAACSMPDSQFAVTYMNTMVVDVWKMVWNQQYSKACLVKVKSHKQIHPTIRLFYSSMLIGVTNLGHMCDVTSEDQDQWGSSCSVWSQSVNVLSVVRNDEKSVWLTGEGGEDGSLGFFFGMGSSTEIATSFCSVTMKFSDEKEKVEKKQSTITAMTVDQEFVVCGDDEGNMWFNQHPDISSWSKRKPVHLDRISELKLTDSVIISASYDRTLKLWDRNTKKQVGMFVCGGPVLFLELNPRKPSELVCADGQGKLYFLSWKD